MDTVTVVVPDIRAAWHELFGYWNIQCGSDGCKTAGIDMAVKKLCERGSVRVSQCFTVNPNGPTHSLRLVKANAWTDEYCEWGD